MILCFQGKQVSAQQATIPVTSEAVLYGKGVFESFLCTQGRVFQLEAHLNRFIQNQTQARIGLDLTLAQLKLWLGHLVQTADLAQLRVKLLAIPEGVWLFGSASEQTAATCAWKLSSYLGHRGSLSHLKSTSYLESLLAFETAQASGADEALLVNNHGTIYEGSRSNFYWLSNQKIRSKKRGVLPGITRDYIATHTPGGIHWETLNLSAIHQIEGAFISNAIRGIVPITHIDQQQIPLNPKITELCLWLAQEREQKAESL